MKKKDPSDENSEKITAYKVNLEELLNSLVLLYEEGVDFVDLEFKFSPEHNNDVVRIIVQPDYYAKDEDEITDDNIDEII